MIGFEIYSTLLPEEVVHTIDFEELDDLDEFNAAIDEVRKATAAQPDAEWRLRCVNSFESKAFQWLRAILDQQPIARKACDYAELLYVTADKFDNDEFEDDHLILLGAYYGLQDRSAEWMLDALENHHFLTWGDPDEDDAYKTFGYNYYIDESGQSANESDADAIYDYTDWAAYGRAIADGDILDWDGDVWVWKEWY